MRYKNITITAVLICTLIMLSFFILQKFPDNILTESPVNYNNLYPDLMPENQGTTGRGLPNDSDTIKEAPENPTPVADSIPVVSTDTTEKRAWHSNWDNGEYRILESGDRDPWDNEFIARGNGTVTIDGSGTAQLKGSSPRMYVYDKDKIKKWNNVEIIFYGKRISETEKVSSQGFVIGVRSEHQDATDSNPCLGLTYYGRLLYDGRANFQKELVHEKAYSDNKPAEDNKVNWGTNSGNMPKNRWVGVKFIVKTNPDGESVKLELYRDMSDGANEGSWEKVAEYTDDGSWDKTDSDEDVKNICGFGANKVILNPGTSVFIRNDGVENAEYKNFSIREI